MRKAIAKRLTLSKVCCSVGCGGVCSGGGCICSGGGVGCVFCSVCGGGGWVLVVVVVGVCVL